jgi:hypothetical protein
MSMKTRGKTKSEGSNQDISKDYNEGRDIENDGLGFSGLIDEKMDEVRKNDCIKMSRLDTFVMMVLMSLCMMT